MKLVFAFALLIVCVSSARILQQNNVMETSVSVSGPDSSGSATIIVSTSNPQTEAFMTSEAVSERAVSIVNEVDIYLLADTSSDMNTALESLRNDATNFVRELFAVANDVRIGVGQYKAPGSQIQFQNIQSITGNQTQTANAIINGWTTSEDTRPRAQLYALYSVATRNGIGFRGNSRKIVVWLGNSPGADPAVNITEASATTALQNRGISVAATNVGSLDSSGQATRITQATNGSLQSFSVSGEPVSSESEAADGGTAQADGMGPGTVVRTEAQDGELSSSSMAGVTLSQAIVQSVEALLA
eukprot:g7862.t1